MRVLLVEPDGDARRIQREVVEAFEGGQTREAADGGEAAEAARAFDPELVIVEGELPDMDGLELVRMLRATHAGAAIIVVASDASRGRVIEAIKAGVSNFLVKPYTPDLLSQRIGETMDTRSEAA